MEGTIGEIRMFGGSFGPRGWALCQGQTLNIQTNTALFAILGTTFGGNGSQTFQLPDFQGRMAVGAGTGPGNKSFALGQVGGNSSITLTTANMPAHNHGITGGVTLQANADNGGLSTDPTNRYLAGTNIFTNENGDLTGMATAGIANTLGIGIAGQSVPFDATPPYLAVNYIVCLEGVFPSRN